MKSLKLKKNNKTISKEKKQSKASNSKQIKAHTTPCEVHCVFVSCS